LAGAGRKHATADGDQGWVSEVHFTFVDKIYIDIGMALFVAWAAFIVFISFQIVNTAWHHRNNTALYIIFASAALLVIPTMLVWLTGFAKRVKAGRFWRHTLIYMIVYRCLYGFLLYCFRSVKSLWVGTRLTVRVALISLISFCMLLFVGIVGAVFNYSGPVPIFLTSLLLTVVIDFFLFRYARRIRNLEHGAREASNGRYETPIDAGRGELGSIADSIMNISVGISTAVEQRMRSERLKTELITNVSHDIRTPLTSIITYTDLLKHEGLDSKDAPEYLEVLTQKSQRLKTLTDDLFEAAKAATGNIEVNVTELNIVSLINQVLAELNGSVSSSGIDLRVNLPEKLLAKADGKLMHRVMENLLSNAFKYSLPASRVYLDALCTDDGCIRIDLKNISASELNFDPSELTERFKRGDDSRADGGSGLGLSIVQSFVSAQGGKFAVSIDGDLFKASVTLPSQEPSLVAVNIKD